MGLQAIFLFFCAGVVVAELAYILVAKFLTKGGGCGGREGGTWPQLLKVVCLVVPRLGPQSSCGPENLLLAPVPAEWAPAPPTWPGLGGLGAGEGTYHALSWRTIPPWALTVLPMCSPPSTLRGRSICPPLQGLTAQDLTGLRDRTAWVRVAQREEAEGE